MKNFDPLQRLFRAAATAPRESPAAPAPALENRALSSWRAAAGEDDLVVLASLFRGAVACAACVMVLSIGWGWVNSRAENSGETALANYALNVQLPP